MLKATSKAFKVAIVGKPNVGKSALFNRLVKRRQSLVFNKAGVTKDCIIGEAVFKGKKFIVTDTAGFTPKIKETIGRTIYSLAECELILFVVHHKIDDEDLLFAHWLRRNSAGKEILLIKNKCDRKLHDDFSELGFNNEFSISAEHNLGMKDLVDYITSKIYIKDPELTYDKLSKREEAFLQAALPAVAIPAIELGVIKPDSLERTAEGSEALKKLEKKPIKAPQVKINIAILGRPNVGKSTLMNKLVQEERSLVSPIAGTTTDPVNAILQYKDKNFNIIDTAGLRKKANVIDSLEIFANSKAIDIIKEADVALMLFDINNLTLEKQDFLIINRILDNGTPIIIIANKADTVNNSEEIVSFIKLQANKTLINEVKIMALSCLKEEDFSALMEECYKIFQASRQKFTTGKLNKWIQVAVNNHRHPLVKGGLNVKFKYIVQIRDRLIFNIYCNYPDLLESSYIQYLKNDFYKSFAIESIPIKFNFKKTGNPYL